MLSDDRPQADASRRRPPEGAPQGHDATRWQRVKLLLADALELPASQRQAFIDREAADEPELKAELAALLEAAQHSRSVLDDMPAELALDALHARVGRSWVGRRVGVYRLVELIARGGMGQVYRAERADGQFEQQVAVKLMREGLIDDATVARFRAERQILATLDHPNLAKVIDGGLSDDGVPYYVMELVSGEPIDAYCRRHALSVEDKVRLFRTVCAVVHYAHQKGVVHRDLKPANILVMPAGVVKLVDFGIAKRLAAAQPGTVTVTATAQRVMTLAYASPEQVRGEEITPASDIFSLGVVLYRLLTDASPYPASATDSDFELGKAICDTEPPPPSQGVERVLRRRLSGDLDAVVLMALRKEPKRRYASAEQLSDDLFRHLEGLPVQARRGAWSYRAGRFVLRHRAVVGAALVANLALVVGLGLAAYEAVIAHRETERAERHFASVRKLANVFIVDVHDAIERLPGSTPARKLIVQNALTYLEQLSTEAQNDADLQVELATGYRHIGDIQGGPLASNLGDVDGAGKSYDRALALCERVLLSKASEKSLSAARREFAIVSRAKASLLTMQGRFDDALAASRKGIAAASEMAKEDPAYRANRRMLATLQMTLAQALALAGRSDEFLGAIKTAAQTLETLHKEEPDEIAIGLNLASAYGTRADHLMNQVGTKESVAQAVTDLKQAAAVMEPLLQKNPNNAMLAANLAVVYSHAGTAEQNLDSFPAAVINHRKAVALLAPLLQKDPDDAMIRVDYATFNGNLSEALLLAGDAKASVSAAKEAIDNFERAPEDARGAMMAMFDRGLTYYRLGSALGARATGPGRQDGEAAADRRLACDSYRHSLVLLDQHKAKFGSNPNFSYGDTALADIHRALERCG